MFRLSRTFYAITFKKTRLLLAVLVLMGSVIECRPLQEQQAYPERIITDKNTRLVQGFCSSEYQASLVTPNTLSAYWTYQEILKPDGHTSMCLYGLFKKPTSWKFSPDGQYLYTFTLLDHNWAYDVYQLSTGKDICDGRGDGNLRFDEPCPPIRLADGRWWSGTFPDIVVKSNARDLWSLINSPSLLVLPVLSPNEEWVAGKSGEWYVASSDGKVINRFNLPYSYRETPTCYQMPGQIAWRKDSRQFAIIQATDKRVFVWSIQEDGSLHQDNSIDLEKCTMTLKLSPDGEILTE